MIQNIKYDNVAGDLWRLLSGGSKYFTSSLWENLFCVVSNLAVFEIPFPFLTKIHRLRKWHQQYTVEFRRKDRNNSRMKMNIRAQMIILIFCLHFFKGRRWIFSAVPGGGCNIMAQGGQLWPQAYKNKNWKQKYKTKTAKS